LPENLHILADIGGTHARFARLENGQIMEPRRVEVAAFSSLEDALHDYTDAQKITHLSLATAAQPDAEGVYRFYNANPWQFDAASLKPRHLVNDFVAAAWGTLAPETQRITLHEGKPDHKAPITVLGPGTGLGLAYVHQEPAVFVQETFGGHMSIATLTEEQHRITGLIRRLKGNGQAVIPEDAASGRGLILLYRALCLQNGVTPRIEDAAEMIYQAGDPLVRQTLRLFHEFLGLFAQQAVVTGHGFGSLVIGGGVAERLYEFGLFDVSSFRKFLMPDLAPIVQAKLETLPIHLISDPFLALRGLALMESTKTS
jgi:glucokinase